MLETIINAVLTWLASYIEIWYLREKSISDSLKVEALKHKIDSDARVVEAEERIRESILTIKEIKRVSDWNSGL